MVRLLDTIGQFFKRVWFLEDDTKLTPEQYVDHYVVGDKYFDRVFISSVLNDETAEKVGKGTNSCRAIRYSLPKIDGQMEQVYVCYDQNTDTIPAYFHNYTRVGEKIKLNYMTEVTNMRGFYVFTIKNKAFLYYHFPNNKLYKRIFWDVVPEEPYRLYYINNNVMRLCYDGENKEYSLNKIDPNGSPYNDLDLNTIVLETKNKRKCYKSLYNILLFTQSHTCKDIELGLNQVLKNEIVNLRDQLDKLGQAKNKLEVDYQDIKEKLQTSEEGVKVLTSDNNKMREQTQKMALAQEAVVNKLRDTTTSYEDAKETARVAKSERNVIDKELQRLAFSNKKIAQELKDQTNKQDKTDKSYNRLKDILYKESKSAVGEDEGSAMVKTLERVLTPTNVPQHRHSQEGGSKLNKIYNPISKEYVSLQSPLGRNILAEYMKELTKNN